MDTQTDYSYLIVNIYIARSKYKEYFNITGMCTGFFNTFIGCLHLTGCPIHRQSKEYKWEDDDSDRIHSLIWEMNVKC